jgi:hypothetical protein
MLYSWHDGTANGGKLSTIDPYTNAVTEISQDTFGIDLLPVSMIYYPPNDRIYFSASVSRNGKIGANSATEGPFIVGVMRPKDFMVERTYLCDYVFTKIIHSKIDDKLYFITSDFIKENQDTVNPRLFTLADLEAGQATGNTGNPVGDSSGTGISSSGTGTGTGTGGGTGY